MAAKETSYVIRSDDLLDVFWVVWIRRRIVVPRLVWILFVTHDMYHVVLHTSSKELPEVVITVSRKKMLEYFRETNVITFIHK